MLLCWPVLVALHEAFFTPLVSQTYCFHKVLSRRELERYRGWLCFFRKSNVPLACFYSTILLFLDIIFYLEWNRKKEEKGKEERKLVRSTRGRLIEVEEGKGGTIHREGTERKSEGVEEGRGRGWRGNFLNGNCSSVIY